MLKQLLTLKKRRERRLRQQMAAGNQRYEQLQHSLQSLNDERKSLQQDWYQLGQEGRGKLARDRLHVIQRELEKHFQNDRALEEEMNSIKAECEAWIQTKAELQQRLQQTRVDQEKLEWIINEDKDAHQ